MRQKTVYSIRSADGRIVGQVSGKVFHKSVRASAHFLRTPPAIAFDICSLESAVEAGAETAEVHDLETGCKYRAEISAVLANGKRFNRGFGLQIFLPLARWSVDGNSPVAKSAVAKTEAVAQLVLI